MLNASAAYQGDRDKNTNIGEIIKGQEDASALIQDLVAECAVPDALFARVQELIPTLARLRGFCRVVQKQIEQGAP
jgi:hypothetical protein